MDLNCIQHLFEGSGVAAVDEILADRPIHHLFVTGDARRVRSNSREAIILQKPFFVLELVAAIDRVLRQSVDV